MVKFFEFQRVPSETTEGFDLVARGDLFEAFGFHAVFETGVPHSPLIVKTDMRDISPLRAHEDKVFIAKFRGLEDLRAGGPLVL
mgnify:CR=1 FL=1